jgi:glutaconate CoA-transferase, subunit B
VITDKGVLVRDAESGELLLTALYPGIEVTDVQAAVGWKLRSSNRVERLEPPTSVELQLLREVLDPQRLYLTS